MPALELVSKTAPRAPSRDLHSSTQPPQNIFCVTLDVYRISRILTNGSRLSHKAGAKSGDSQSGQWRFFRVAGNG
jgi:hypothetical protein